MGKFSEFAYAILRVIAGLMFAMHGAQKLLGWPGHKAPVVLASRLGAAGVIEFVCGVFIAVGLLAGFAAFLACGEMAFAYFTVHFPNGPYPILNGGELAVLYCFVYLLVATRGSGIISIDALRGKGKGRR
ncbi:MAG TPA: DoxX family protein [Blastocatellia bacterium]|nr:DoxX family protein [Blastocatellia bacterium]